MKRLREVWGTFVRGSLSPLALAGAAVMCVGLGVLHETARVVRRSAEISAATARAADEIVAEAAILRCAAEERTVAQDEFRGRSVDVVGDANGWTAHLRGAGAPPRAYHCERLPGAAAEAFARPCTVRLPSLAELLPTARVVAAAGFPRFSDEAMAAVQRGDGSDCFVRDAGVALSTWSVGTDGPDYVLGPFAGQAWNVGADVFVVPGHLWLPPHAEPVIVRLTRDVLVVVRGNLYLGNSVRVYGGGRLVFHVQPGPDAVAFADRDGNGRWSAGDRCCDPVAAFAGPIEGGGSAFLGLPGANARLSCEAGLVVEGELHLRASVTVSGPLVLGSGVTRNAPEGRVQPTGAWTFDVEREAVPGMATTGLPRPGRLRELDLDGAAKREQTLYAASPAR
jgi:hypothetical protein